MKSSSRKTVFLVLSALLLCAGLVLAKDILKDYSHTVPVVVGPRRESVLIILALLSALSLYFAFNSVKKRTISGAICITFAVLWFIGQMLLRTYPGNESLLEQMDHWFPLPLLLFGIGAFLLADDVLTKYTVVFQNSADVKLFCGLLLMFIMLQPVLRGGFYWDDAFFSAEAQNMRLSGISIYERVWKEIVDYVRIGRINPFATFHFLVFYYLPDVRLYKIMLVLLSLLSGFLFYRFLCVWKKNSSQAIAALLFTVLCFQFRLYHDPLNSYYGLMQVMFCELMGSLIFYLYWLRKGKSWHLVFSLICFAMGLMSYEMFFPLTALFLVLAFEQEKHIGRTIKRSLPWVLSAIFLFGLSMLLRRNITEETAYTGTSFSFDIPLIMRTFATQVGSALPLSYRNAGYDNGVMGTLIQWHRIFNTSLKVFWESIQWQDLFGCLILTVTLYGIAKGQLHFSGYGLLFGLLLCLLPGLVISLSTKYQVDLVPGLAYIPVFFSYFGIGMVFWELFALAGRFISMRVLRPVLCGCCCMILLLGLQDNRHVSDMLDEWFLYPRKAGEEALQSGILDQFESGTMVISAVPYSLWEHGWLREPYQDIFYSINARKPVNAVGVWDYVEQNREEQPLWVTPVDTVVMTYSGNDQGGFAKCGVLNGTAFDFDAHELVTPMTSDVFFYVSGKNRQDVSLIYETRDAEWKQLPVRDAWLIRETADGALYKLNEKRPVLFDTIGIRTY